MVFGADQGRILAVSQLDAATFTVGVGPGRLQQKPLG